ncbi:hypothetical protein WS86_05340 [Burkholderia savannae]|nr:hypothetical protein WS86_05340 [Burkholderia savannae]
MPNASRSPRCAAGVRPSSIGTATRNENAAGRRSFDAGGGTIRIARPARRSRVQVSFASRVSRISSTPTRLIAAATDT